MRTSVFHVANLGRALTEDKGKEGHGKGKMKAETSPQGLLSILLETRDLV